MVIRLTAKLAEVVDGIDLTHCSEGDVIELTDDEGHLLIAEGWAVAVQDGTPLTCATVDSPTSTTQPDELDAAPTTF